MMAPVVKEALNACRVCLAVNVKMYHMKSFKLSEMFQNITGISVIENNDSLLQRVCWECAARLTAAAAFREKALFTDALLKTQVNIKESDIALLKQNYSSLKSPLCVKTAVNSFDIECEHTISENEIENTLKNIKTETNINETSIEFEVCEPWVGFPVKTEVDSDSISDDNMELEDRKSVTVDEHFNDTSSKEDGGSQLVNTEPQINNTEKIARGDIDNKAFENEVPVLNNVNIVFIKEEPEVEKKPKLDSFGNIVHEASSGEDRHIEGVSCDKEKQNKSKVAVKNIKKGKAANRINESLREKIIALRKKRFSVPAIVKETGASVASIRSVLYRSNCNVRYHRYASQTEVESDSEQKEAGKELTACSPTVRKRMREAGFEHILMKKPEVAANVPQNLSKNKELHNHLKQRIIALKQEGMSISRIAYLLDTTRMTVRKWWERWCNEGHMDNYKSPGPKKKTSPQEDKLLIERVTQEGSIHTPSLAKELGISTKCVRSRLRAAGFILENRKPSVPLRSGRNHKVDEATKQQIISMKHNGVGVTEIANQFRVTEKLSITTLGMMEQDAQRPPTLMDAPMETDDIVPSTSSAVAHTTKSNKTVAQRSREYRKRKQASRTPEEAAAFAAAHAERQRRYQNRVNAAAAAALARVTADQQSTSASTERSRPAQTNAERQRAYRQRRRLEAAEAALQQSTSVNEPATAQIRIHL